MTMSALLSPSSVSAAMCRLQSNDAMQRIAEKTRRSVLHGSDTRLFESHSIDDDRIISITGAFA